MLTFSVNSFFLSKKIASLTIDRALLGLFKLQKIRFFGEASSTKSEIFITFFSPPQTLIFSDHQSFCLSFLGHCLSFCLDFLTATPLLSLSLFTMFVFPKSSFQEMSSLDSTKQCRCNFCSEKIYHPSFHGPIWECNACGAWVHQCCMSLKDSGDSCSCGSVSFSIVSHASCDSSDPNFVFTTTPSPIPTWSPLCSEDSARMKRSGPNPNSDLQCHDGCQWQSLPLPHRTFQPSASCGCHQFGCHKCDAVARNPNTDWALSFCVGCDKRSQPVHVSTALRVPEEGNSAFHSQLARANFWNPTINPDAHLAICGCKKGSHLHPGHPKVCPRPILTSISSPFPMRQTMDPCFDPIAQKIAHLIRTGKKALAQSTMLKWFGTHGSPISLHCGCPNDCTDVLTCQRIKAISPTNKSFRGHIWICPCWPPCSFGSCEWPRLVPRSALLVRAEEGLTHASQQHLTEAAGLLTDTPAQPTDTPINGKRKGGSPSHSTDKKRLRGSITQKSSVQQPKITTFFPPISHVNRKIPREMLLTEFDCTPFKEAAHRSKLGAAVSLATPLDPKKVRLSKEPFLVCKPLEVIFWKRFLRNELLKVTFSKELFPQLLFSPFLSSLPLHTLELCDCPQLSSPSQSIENERPPLASPGSVDSASEAPSCATDEGSCQIKSESPESEGTDDSDSFFVDSEASLSIQPSSSADESLWCPSLCWLYTLQTKES